MSSHPARSRGAAGRRFLLVLVLILLAGGGSALILTLRERSTRIAVVVEAPRGTIHVGSEPQGPGPVTWVCEDGDPQLMRVDQIIVGEEEWAELVRRTHSDAAVEVGIMTSTQQIQMTTGAPQQTINVQSVALTVTPPGEDPFPALGLAAGVREGGGLAERLHLALVRLDVDGVPVAISAESLIEDRNPSFIERLRGMPDHYARYELKLDEDESLEGNPGAADEEEIRRRIERLRGDRPERGVIPPQDRTDPGSADDEGDG